MMHRPSNRELFLSHSNVELPIIGGAMYPCSNPELVAAVSENGGIGIVQPVSLTYVFGYDFLAGLRYIKSLTSKPVGLNVLIESTSKRYRNKMTRWIDIALEEGIRFFVTSMGKPDWVVAKVHPHGGVVYHDVTARRWALKAIDCGVDGLIAVNSHAGGHAGQYTAKTLYEALSDYDLPLVCAGGIADPQGMRDVLALGYAGVQLGTRFIASNECRASIAYKNAIVHAQQTDIVLSERISGVPVALINTPQVQRFGLSSNAFEKWMLRHPQRKKIMRLIYALKSLRLLKHTQQRETEQFWLAGKSVEHIDRIKPVATIMSEFRAALIEN